MTKQKEEILIKKKYGVPLETEIYHFKIKKLKRDFTGEEDEKSYFECWIKQPNLMHMDSIFASKDDRLFSTTKGALKSLWLTGDDIIKEDDELIMAAAKWILSDLFTVRELEFEKK